MGESEGAAQQYCLRWNNHSESIVSEFEILLGQEDFVDVTLSCDKRSLKAHKVVLSACSAYFRRLLKENPCQHPIIILRDVGYAELVAILHFIYHGQVMVEQERIPQLVQTAQMLEVRGLCEIREGDRDVEASSLHAKEESDPTPAKGNRSFLAGLLGQTSISATKRTLTAASSNNPSAASPPPLIAAKRQRSTSRPVPMLQSILSQQLAVPTTPMFDLGKSMASSSRPINSMPTKVLSSCSNTVTTSSTTTTNNCQLPTTLETMLSGLASTSSTGHQSAGDAVSQCSTTSSAPDDADALYEKDAARVESSSCGEPSVHEGAADMEADALLQIKEEPTVDFEDEYCDDSDTRGGATGDEDGPSESEMELGPHTCDARNRGGEASLLPLLAQHLAAPSLLSASAKLRAAASQARVLHSTHGSAASAAAAAAAAAAATVASLENPLIAQALLVQPATPPDMGPASVGTASESASPSGEQPRKLAFHEPRPCPICRRMYRDAATLRTHTAIMHAEGRDPFACLCGELFRTKYEMYMHKKNGHR